MNSHTWLPYITPNGVRLAREVLKKLTFLSRARSYIYNFFFPSIFLVPDKTPKGNIHGKSKIKIIEIRKSTSKVSYKKKLPNPFSHEKEFGGVFLKTSFCGSGAKTHFK